MSQFDRIWKHFQQPRSAVGLAVFRIAYSLTLLGEVIQVFSLRHLFYDATPYLNVGGPALAPAFGLWMAAIVCLALGFMTRQASLINYVMTLLIFSTSGYWEYHVDYIYTGIGFFLLFIPVERTLSIDAWLAARRATRNRTPLPSTNVPRVHYDALILVGIAAVYFDSVFYKLASPMWMSGLGVWRPASIPHNTYWNVGWLLDVKWLMLSMGYLTLVFEALFVVAMWFDRLRPLLLLIGMGLHLGIVVMFPIPWFGLAVAALYVLLIPDDWWTWLGSLFSKSASTTSLNDSAIALSRSENRTAAGVAMIAVVLTLAQVLQSTRSDLAKKFAARYGLQTIQRTISDVARKVHYPSRVLFGITPHPVFMDFHFDGYESFFTLVHVDDQGRQTWLPMANELGQGRLAWSGRLWLTWTWKVCSAHPDAHMLQRGFRIVSAWWLTEQGLGLADQKLLIMRRKCDPFDGWTKGYYQQQLTHDWQPVGTVQWTDRHCEVTFEPTALESIEEALPESKSPSLE